MSGQERAAADIRREYVIEGQTRLTDAVMELRLAGDTRRITAPGQFVNIALPGLFLRRPISVSDWDSQGMTLVYKIVGEGTKRLAQARPGQRLELLTGLGNGFDPAAVESGKRPLVVGGGVGVPPMLGLTKALAAAGAPPVVILGFNTAAEIFYEDKFRQAGAAEVRVTTADGSRGIPGFVTDALAGLGTVERYFACGPLPMLRALWQSLPGVRGQLSFEERMACGFGACMGCGVKTKAGDKRICKDGPVLESDEICW